MYLRNVNMLIYQTLGCHIPEIWKSHVLSNITCSNTVGSDCNANFRKHQILMWLRGANFIDYFLKWMNISFCMSFVEIQMSTCPNYTVPQSDRPLREINPCIYTPLSVLYIYIYIYIYIHYLTVSSENASNTVVPEVCSAYPKESATSSQGIREYILTTTLKLTHLFENVSWKIIVKILVFISYDHRLFVCLFLTQQPPVDHGMLNHEVSRSHTTTQHRL